MLTSINTWKEGSSRGDIDLVKMKAELWSEKLATKLREEEMAIRITLSVDGYYC